MFVIIQLLIGLFVFPILEGSTLSAIDPNFFSAQEPSKKTLYKLSRPLVGDDGRVYACSERNFFVFESNGTISWAAHLNYTCNADIAPVSGGRGKIYLVADGRLLKIEFSLGGDAESQAGVFFGREPGQEAPGDIIGFSVSTSLSSVFINVRNRALFAFNLRGRLLWSAGPMLYQFGYPQGCRKNATDCYFTSVPVIDLCEASVYIANNEGELYSISVHAPHFRWIHDFSSFDRILTITPGNNGRLYVTVPVRSLLFALDVLTGNVIWQSSIGPLSTSECAPVVDSNGWISVGSLDGFLYSLSPTGNLKKFPKKAKLDSVIQVSPLPDCSGFAIYVARTEMDGKTSHLIGENTYISALKPRVVVFTVLVPASGSIYWSQRSPGEFSALLFDSDLRHFILDERILLAFITASKIGNPLPCRPTREKISSTCSQAETKHHKFYTGNEKAILWFLLFETLLLIILAFAVRFCCIFWRKKKLQNQNLPSFLEKRRSLQLKRKALSRTITHLEKKATEEAVSNEAVEQLSDLVRSKRGIERKLSSTYSLGRDKNNASPSPNSLLPLYDGSSNGYSFRGPKKESVTIFRTLSNTSSSSSYSSSSGWETDDDYEASSSIDAKGKKKVVESSSDGNDHIMSHSFRGNENRGM